MKKFWITLNGKSMTPLLEDGDQVLIEMISPEKICQGDIVLFLDSKSQELTLHRFMSFPLLTKGDYSLNCENNPSSALIGRALGYERHFRFYSLACRNSFFMKMFLLLSKMRMRNPALRLLSIVLMNCLKRVFEFCNDETTLDYNEALLPADL